MELVSVNNIRSILIDDFSMNEIDRIIMAMGSNDPSKTSFDLQEIRSLLVEDFSLGTINRVIMTLKLSQVPTN